MWIEYDEHGNAKVIRSEHIEQPDKEKRNPHKFYDITY